MPNSDMDVYEVDGKPDAIVMLFGWLGSKLRNVNKYSQLYHARNCSTITGVADSYAVLAGQMAVLDDFCKAATKEAAKLVKKYPDVPIVVHVFSNGGAFPLLRLEAMMDQALLSERPSPMDKDLCLLRDAMQRGCQLFDSCPVYPGPKAASRAIASSVSNQYLGMLIQVVYLVWISMDTFILWLKGEPARAELYWQHLLGMTFGPKQGYIYSTVDHIADAARLEHLINTRKGQGLDVAVLRFEDSDHVLHLRNHPKQYCAFIDEMLKKVELGHHPATI
jgi:hypothetical protein